MMGNILKKLFSTLFPPTCILCGLENSGVNICAPCINKLELTREMRRPWLFSLYRYKTEPVSTCIRHLKNFPDQDMINKLISLRRFMVENWTLGLVRSFQSDSIVIVPVPIHKSRFVDRGYNQADIIASAYKKVIEKKMSTYNIPIRIENNLITKPRKTDKQALITDKNIRKLNIKNAFSIQKDRDVVHLGQSLVIIIDDVTTTGGTLDEIRTLLAPQAKAVFAFTLAH
jgi:ComF family protein